MANFLSHLCFRFHDAVPTCYRHEAEVANQSKAKEGVKGTPAWMAPELIDARDVTTKADVFSFAVVLWEMLTRRQPYQGCSTYQVSRFSTSGLVSCDDLRKHFHRTNHCVV